MASKKKKSLIDYVNYKDFFIILGSWYFSVFLLNIIKQISFHHPLLTDFMHFLCVVSHRFIFLAFLIFYISLFYPVSFENLGLSFKKFKSHFFNVFIFLISLLIVSVLIINVPLSLNTELLVENFRPLYQITSPDIFTGSLLALLLITIGSTLLALCELLLLITFIYNLFKDSLKYTLISSILTGLFYSVLLLQFNPGKILINTIVILITLLIYNKNSSLLASALFMGGYYGIYIVYIYGWNYIF